MHAGPIDVYVAALRRTLRGPRAAKADLVTEARDSLVDAAEHYEEGGLDRLAAERRAVDEFGAVHELAPDYQRELALAQARRTALIVAGAVAAQSVISEMAWRSASTGWSWEPDRFYAVLANTVDYASYVVFAVALVTALVCGIGTRFVTVGRRFARATGVATLAAVAFFAIGGMLLSALSPTWDTAVVMPGSPLQLVSNALALALPAGMIFSGLRSIRAATTARA
ncbi:permease prefix domain 1-containing protein [Dactylosporangium sp. AC04546]|uniref:permease prefix domain 1-containing protein n=1 Tax=Dactylosporangium sp. AC04546 TaxID=2862460 RepID=UPI001EDF29F7|nr:permease prefix domain 1-containing protein [Dactylosporangium sp. AC04546]WVK84988.1 permease prefix domain 1-containing protein [Dactylosporangium sp. AC04546]